EGRKPLLDCRLKSDRFSLPSVVYWKTRRLAVEQTFEATIEKCDKWYIGWVDAVPGAFSQGRTVKEVEENLKEAVQLILESQRDLRDQGASGEVLKRKIQVQV
ncbi:MAG: type II toxin-antitoxin system HicB family antitoxin, partial [Chloroflexi bacterium]|nr:type II toxin-antitoxin system HicB family antitoxin [Chloroflexota bacterium]